ncbi:hypothetical protein PspLS_09405 [Pyricularia sp. CBS 133598]|nr:hypothetical protein PspLS_09405 [Pyricularia sp. CBS 133598]
MYNFVALRLLVDMNPSLQSPMSFINGTKVQPGVVENYCGDIQGQVQFGATPTRSLPLRDIIGSRFRLDLELHGKVYLQCPTAVTAAGDGLGHAHGVLEQQDVVEALSRDMRPQPLPPSRPATRMQQHRRARRASSSFSRHEFLARARRLVRRWRGWDCSCDVGRDGDDAAVAPPDMWTSWWQSSKRSLGTSSMGREIGFGLRRWRDGQSARLMRDMSSPVGGWLSGVNVGST